MASRYPPSAEPLSPNRALPYAGFTSRASTTGLRQSLRAVKLNRQRSSTAAALPDRGERRHRAGDRERKRKCSSRWRPAPARRSPWSTGLSADEVGRGRRVLFLVDRRALAAQAVRAFASFEAEPGLKFDKIYEVYSQRSSVTISTRTRTSTRRSCRRPTCWIPSRARFRLRLHHPAHDDQPIWPRSRVRHDEEPSTTTRKARHPHPRLRPDHRRRVPRGYTGKELRSGARHSTTSTRSRSASRPRRPPTPRPTSRISSTATSTTGRCARVTSSTTIRSRSGPTSA